MLINESLIHLACAGKTKEDILKELAGIADQQGKLESQEGFISAVLKREEEYSTAVGFGVAIPHGKSAAVKEPFLMFAKFDAVDWKALDDEPVEMLFLIGVPEADAGSTHLTILAKLSRKLMKKDFREQLRDKNTAQEIMQVLIESELGL